MKFPNGRMLLYLFSIILYLHNLYLYDVMLLGFVLCVTESKFTFSFHLILFVRAINFDLDHIYIFILYNYYSNNIGGIEREEGEP